MNNYKIIFIIIHLKNKGNDNTYLARNSTIRKKADFEDHLNKTRVEDAISLDGNLGSYVKIVEQDRHAHFFLCTVWSS